MASVPKPEPMKTFITLISFILIMLNVNAQVNGYAKVTLIAGPLLTVSDVNETYDQFNIGDKVIIIQMQDDVIGSNTGNNSSFGNLATIANAGKFEIATISLVARVLGIANLITLTGPLNNTYSLNSNSSLQIITFPTLGSPNYNTSSNITALPWNGNIGGVVAFNVNGKLTLQHNITANNAGFRGGAMDANNSTDAGCNDATFYSPVSVLHGNKGEGIYKVTNSNYAAANGRMINGGGGGNGHNGGGGGGSNYTGGGDGATGYNCTIISGGYGGAPLNTNISGQRYFLGGGGGSGEANNGGNNKGGNGGGIVIVKATELKTNGSTPITISANGENGGSVLNDGAGGGGAGGSVFMEVNIWNISSSAPLTITSNGGNGGNVVDGARHGGGAGGGQGAAIYTGIVPTVNTTTATSVGTGGLNWTGGVRAPSGVGTNNSGVITTTFIILPVKLISFNGTVQGKSTLLDWATESETAFSHYEIQFSENGSTFYNIGKVMSHGNGNLKQLYNFVSDVNFNGTQYYRLKMIDVDGKSSYSKIIAVRKNTNATPSMSIYPNPVTKNPVLNIKSTEVGEATVSVLTMQGSILSNENVKLRAGDNTTVLQSVNNLPSAVYNVKVIINGKTFFTRLIVQK